MTKYINNMPFRLCLDSEEEAVFCKQLLQVADTWQDLDETERAWLLGSEENEKLTKFLATVASGNDLVWKQEGLTFLFSSASGYAVPKQAAEFCLCYMKKFNKSGTIGISWSYHCEEDIPGSSGGGIVLVTRDSWTIKSTTSMMHELINRLGLKPLIN